MNQQRSARIGTKWLHLLCIVSILFLAFGWVTPMGAFAGSMKGNESTQREATSLNQPCTEWNLALDFKVDPNQQNPNPDSCGEPDVWHFMRSDFNRQTYTLLDAFTNNIWGITGLQDWGNAFPDQLPVIGINATGKDQQNGTSILPAGAVYVHPLNSEDAVVAWHSPIDGLISITGTVSDNDPGGGNGIKWYIDKNTNNLVSGSIEDGGAQSFRNGTGGESLEAISVHQGDFLYFAIDPKDGNYGWDNTRLDIQIHGSSGIYLAPSKQTLTGYRGSTVQFIETLGNITGITDTFHLTMGASAWPAVLSTDTIGPLVSGKEATFKVNITIPTGVASNSSNSVIITATSSVSPSVRLDTALLTARAYFSPHTFLPSLTKAPPVVPGMAGKVTVNGDPAPDVPLELRFYDGSNWSTINSTSTGSDGSYVFRDAPAVAQGQGYYVRYVNNSDPSRLFTWHTGVNTTYDAASLVAFDTFDIANITLSTPQPGSIVKLPFTFTWIPRPATPKDSYELNLFDANDGDPWFYTDPLLGYTGSYTLAKLPVGFKNGVIYGWEVAVYAPDNGYGISYYFYYLKFKSSLSAPEVLVMKSADWARQTIWEAPGIPADR